MFETEQQLLGFVTVLLVLLGVAAVAVFRMNYPRKPNWIPGFFLLSSMLFVAFSSFCSLYYDYAASLIQGVTLVSMAVCVSVETRKSKSSTSCI